MTKTFKMLEPSGILDGEAGNALRLQIVDTVPDCDIILVDMQQITFMNSSGIGSLVAALKAVRASGKNLHICGLTDQAKLIFELTKMDRVFKPFGNQAEFQAKVLC